MIEILELRIAPAVLLTHAGQLANDPDAPNVITTDFDGNIYVAGKFRGTIDVNLGPAVTNLTTTDDNGDVYLVKYDPDYRLLWATRWGGDGDDAASDIVTNGSEVFVTGTFSSSNAGFGGSGTLNAGSVPQAFIFKVSADLGVADPDFDGDGQLSFGNGSTPSHGNTLVLENSGTLLFGGDFQGLNNGLNGSGSYTAGSQNGIVLRLDRSTGDQLFSLGSSFGAVVIAFGDVNTDSVFKIEVGEGSDLFIGFSTFDGTSTSYQVVRYDFAGTSPVEGWSNGYVDLGTDLAQVDFLLDNAYQVTGAALDSAGTLKLFRYFSSNGIQDPTYGQNGTGFATLSETVGSVTLGIDSLNRLFVAGEASGKNYLARIDNVGRADQEFGGSGLLFFGNPATTPAAPIGLAVDSEGYVILNGGYVGSPDLDPGKDVKKLPARFAPDPDASETLEDSFLLRVDPSGVKAGQPLIISVGFSEIDDSEMRVIVSLTGPGRAHVIPSFFEGTGSLDEVELFGTTLASNLKIEVENSFVTRAIGTIYTHGNLQHMGSIQVSPDLIIGYEPDLRDPEPEPIFFAERRADGQFYTIHVSGKLNSLVVGDLELFATIRLGSGLPYNEPDNTTPDTRNNRPNLTIGNILGRNVLIDVTGDGSTPGGVGGGGLGRVVIASWGFEGLLRTTQGIGSFIIQNGDFLADLEVDKFHLGEGTTANVGEMTVQDGAWGSSGTEVEGNIAEFNAEAFLAEASITAGSISKINVDGPFQGEVNLTEANANSFGTFNVTTDFTGKIESLSPLKKLNIKGDFKGSLKAPAIAAITAFSFIGTTAEDGEGDPTKLNITTTTGLLGKITAKTGTIRDYEFSSPVAFGGIKVALKNLTEGAIAVENVIINAASIGPIDISLAGKANAGGVNLTGIANSTFTTSGKMGAVTVKLKGATGQSVGLVGVNFVADSIGKVLINVTKGLGAAATAQAVNVANFTATQGIGAITISGDSTEIQASELSVWAGGTIAGLSVSAKVADLGSLIKSSILAGQRVDLQAIESAAVLKRRLALGTLGAVKVSGSIQNSLLAAGGDVTKVTTGVDLISTRILAGALLGDDRLVGNGDDRFHRGSQIAGIAIKGALSESTISTGVDPVNGIIGDDDDAAAAGFEGFEVIAAVKALSVGIELTSSPTVLAPHSFAIQAGQIGKITLGKTKLPTFTQPLFLDVAPTGEGPEDIVVRTLV